MPAGLARATGAAAPARDARRYVKPGMLLAHKPKARAVLPATSKRMT